jgi:FtsP/CotA-like multicopper oxidase with cupredoxin domain
MLAFALVSVVVAALQQVPSVVPAAPRLPLPRPVAGAPLAAINDNRVPAGRLHGDTLDLRLEVVDAAWRPEGPDDPAVPVLAFAEPGKAPSVPSPLVRARVGTVVQLTLRNGVDSALVIGGLRGGAGMAKDTITLAPRATRTVTFRLTKVGSYLYWGALKQAGFWENREWLDSQLTGALVVDPATGAAPDRIFVITDWFLPRADREFEDALVFNGKAWPHTERLTLTQGDSVHWRVINGAAVPHPIHLHGFYFRAERLGGWNGDSAIAPARQRLANVQFVEEGGTMALAFVPTQPGNWVLHCHFADHVSPVVSLVGAATDSTSARVVSHSEHDAVMTPGRDPMSGHSMRGLVLGIHVTPAPSYVARATPTHARQLRLVAQTQPNRLPGKQLAYGFMLQRGDSAPARDVVSLPAPLLELERGAPVRITVVNHLDEPTGVHWHGLEIESFPDGVPAWSGVGTRIMPPIAPGDSFVAEFTPPRAGTFLYHAHADELRQIASGMYGALLVLDAPRDTLRDHVVVAGSGGVPVFAKGLSMTGLVNGRYRPDPVRVTPGVPNRFRLVSIDATVELTYQLTSDAGIARWRQVAKDGADLPPALRTVSPARITLGPGETADFEWTPPPGTGPWRLHVASPPVDFSSWLVTVPIAMGRAP